MKKLLISAILLFISTFGYAVSAVWISSYTATADTTQNLCINKNGLLHGIVVSSASATNGGLVSIYASSATVDSTMAVVDTTGRGSYFYDTVAIATNTAGSYDYTGLTYSKVGTASVTILYYCY